jgi:hypothetical protein
MGTVKHHGWSKPGDEIPQPVGIVMGRNLRKPAPVPPQDQRDLQEIEKAIKDQEGDRQ